MLGSGEGAHAAGDFLPEFGHPHFSLGRVVVKRHDRVDGEPQVVLDAGVDPAAQGTVLLVDLAGFAPAGSEAGGVGDQRAVLCQLGLIDGYGAGVGEGF